MLWRIRDAKERLVFISLGSIAQPKWKRIEDDFVLGACAHSLFGYISQDVRGEWTAFDSDAHPLGHFGTLPAAQSALWAAHQQTHDAQCVPPRRSWWNRRSTATHTELVTAPSPN